MPQTGGRGHLELVEHPRAVGLTRDVWLTVTHSQRRGNTTSTQKKEKLTGSVVVVVVVVVVATPLSFRR